jgi:hypothetical protein
MLRSLDRSHNYIATIADYCHLYGDDARNLQYLIFVGSPSADKRIAGSRSGGVASHTSMRCRAGGRYGLSSMSTPDGPDEPILMRRDDKCGTLDALGSQVGRYDGFACFDSLTSARGCPGRWHGRAATFGGQLFDQVSALGLEMCETAAGERASNLECPYKERSAPTVSHSYSI